MKLLLSLLLVTLAFAFQLPQPIPPFQGDGNPQHDGQPRWCQNKDDAHLHNCECMKTACDRDGQPGGDERPTCKVYCRRNACRCQKPCQTE
jgi:hypothetical protein